MKEVGRVGEVKEVGKVGEAGEVGKVGGTEEAEGSEGEGGTGEATDGRKEDREFRRVRDRFGEEGSFESLFLSEEISLDRIFPVSTASVRHSTIAASSASARSWTRYSCERTSPAEPFAMVRKWMKSGVDSRSKPSAMLDITETAARRS